MVDWSLREAFPALVTKTVSADTGIAAAGSSFSVRIGRRRREIKELASSTSWAVEDVRAHHHALTGDPRDVNDTCTGGPPKHHTQHDFGAAWRPRAQGDPSPVFCSPF